MIYALIEDAGTTYVSIGTPDDEEISALFDQVTRDFPLVKLTWRDEFAFQIESSPQRESVTHDYLRCCVATDIQTMIADSLAICYAAYNLGAEAGRTRALGLPHNPQTDPQAEQFYQLGMAEGFRQITQGGHRYPDCSALDRKPNRTPNRTDTHTQSHSLN